MPLWVWLIVPMAVSAGYIGVGLWALAWLLRFLDREDDDIWLDTVD